MNVYRGWTHIMSMKLLLFLSFLSIFYFLLKTKAAQQTAKSRTLLQGWGNETNKKNPGKKSLQIKMQSRQNGQSQPQNPFHQEEEFLPLFGLKTENLYKSGAKLQEILSCAWMLWRKMQEKEIIWPFLAEQIGGCGPRMATPTLCVSYVKKCKEFFRNRTKDSTKVS